MTRTLLAGCISLFFMTSNLSAQFSEDHIFVGTFSGVVYEIDPVTFEVTIFADSSDGLSGTSAVAFTRAHTLLTSNYTSSEVIEFDSSGNGTVVLDANDGLNGPFGENGIALDRNGLIYVSNYNDNRILRFQSDYTGGTVFADASDGIVNPDGLAFVAGGDLVVANRSGGGTVLRIAPDGTTIVFDTILDEDCFSAVVRNNGDIYIGCVSGNIYRYIGGASTGRVLLGTYSGGNIALEFSNDHSILYSASSADSTLRTIDPDTGVDTIVATTLFEAAGIAVFGSECPPGDFVEYGSGLAGAGGIVPALHGTGHANSGGTVTLEVRDFVGGASSVLLLGIAADDFPAFGGSIYVSCNGPFLLGLFTLPGDSGAPGEGDMDLTGSLPNDPSLRCLHIFMQWLAVDASAVQGVLMSNALDMFIGD